MNRKLKEAVLHALGDIGPAAHEDVATRLSVSLYSVKPVIRVLFEAGLVQKAGTRRDFQGSGGAKTLWSLAPGVEVPAGAIEAYQTPTSFEAQFWARVERGTVDVCWRWLGSFLDTGYGQSWSPAKRNEGAHRVSWRLTHGDIPLGLYVLHKCDNRACVNPSHLFLGTQKDNMRDCARKGRNNTARGDANGTRTKPESRPRAETHGMARLSWTSVREIRALFAAGSSQAELSRQFGVSSPTIHAVVHNQRWVEDGQAS